MPNTKRLTAYQKLKQENKALRQDIYDLVVNKDKEQGISTYIRYKRSYNVVDAILAGDATKDGPFVAQGIFTQSQKQ